MQLISNHTHIKMKRLSSSLSVLIALSAFTVSCNNSNQKTDTEQEDSLRVEVPNTESSTTPSTSSSFDINTIAISDKELGEFPFFSLPEGLALLNKKPIERKFDRIFFPIDGVMTPIEGRVWKADISTEGRKHGEWSLPYFEKSYTEAIVAVGGVKIFDGKVSKDEIDRIKDEATYFGEGGSIDYWNSPVKVYVIRRADGGDVYIQFSGNTAGGRLQILQQEAFKQTITMLKSDEIATQLNEKGKAVLHINFDTDKATLKPDGVDAVNEITKVLKADNTLKLEINGYTDNSGTADHNKKLSEARAATVKSELITAGISADRLSSNGYGQDNPIADNTTEEGKAQNRRVELVKK